MGEMHRMVKTEEDYGGLAREEGAKTEREKCMKELMAVGMKGAVHFLERIPAPVATGNLGPGKIKQIWTSDREVMDAVNALVDAVNALMEANR
jgi:hypothetical protein